jgi:ribonuclease-3
MPADDITHFEEVAGIEFRDKSLLARALTHSSYVNEHPELAGHDNERLEFLGDAVLDLVVGEMLYHRFPESSEGDLTSLRAALVRRETLASLAKQIQLGQHLRMGKGEQDSGGRDRLATLCAAFEALIGAIHIDKGIEVATDFLAPLIEPEIDFQQSQAILKDPRSRLQEWTQAEMGVTPEYRTAAETGPDHARQFTVEVLVLDCVRGSGTGSSKQKAALAAAAAALSNMRSRSAPVDQNARSGPAPTN